MEHHQNLEEVINNKINYDEVNEVLKKEKIKSLDWLKNALNSQKTKNDVNFDIINQLIQKQDYYNGNNQDLENKLYNINNKIKLPKFLCKLICCFILKKKNRKHFRKKYMKNF